MVEDKHKVKTKELAGLIMLGVGIVLVSSIIFSGLGLDLQANVANAVQIFDMSENIDRPLGTVTFVFETGEKFMDETYIASQQLLVASEDHVESATELVNNFLRYSESLAMSYSQTNIAQKDYVFEAMMAFDEQKEGRVAGESVESFNGNAASIPNPSPRRGLGQIIGDLGEIPAQPKESSAGMGEKSQAQSNNGQPVEEIIQEIKKLLDHARLSF